MDRGDWRVTVHRVPESDVTELLSMHTCTEELKLSLQEFATQEHKQCTHCSSSTGLEHGCQKPQLQRQFREFLVIKKKKIYIYIYMIRRKKH